MNERTKGFTLVELLVVIAILGLLASLIVPAVGYAMFVANKGMCKHKVKSMAKVSEVLHTLDDSPIGNKWCEGFEKTGVDPDVEFTDNTNVATDMILKSRLAFWRVVADPLISSKNVGPGGPSAFICPGASGPKDVAAIGNRDDPNPDFGYDKGGTQTVDDIPKQLWYSMFCQRDGTGSIVPTYGTRPNFVVMGDRNPASDDETPTNTQNSVNHTWGAEQTGQNICYSSGTVEWADEPTVGIDEDNIYTAGATETAPTSGTFANDDDDTVLMPVK